MNTELRPCPICKEPIQPAATKCRFCQEYLPPGWSSSASSSHGAAPQPPPLETPRRQAHATPGGLSRLLALDSESPLDGARLGRLAAALLILTLVGEFLSRGGAGENGTWSSFHFSYWPAFTLVPLGSAFFTVVLGRAIRSGTVAAVISPLAMAVVGIKLRGYNPWWGGWDLQWALAHGCELVGVLLALEFLNRGARPSTIKSTFGLAIGAYVGILVGAVFMALAMGPSAANYELIENPGSMLLRCLACSLVLFGFRDHTATKLTLGFFLFLAAFGCLGVFAALSTAGPAGMIVPLGIAGVFGYLAFRDYQKSAQGPAAKAAVAAPTGAQPRGDL